MRWTTFPGCPGFRNSKRGMPRPRWPPTVSACPPPRCLTTRHLTTFGREYKLYRSAFMKLTRSIGLVQAVAMVVGTIVGSSIFVQPSEVSRAVPSFGGMVLVWIAAGALTWFGASVCAELASAYPRTGGVYVFLREMFSPA